MACRPAISSHSLGRAWVYDLPEKLDQAAKYGFDIELFFEDLYYIADSLPEGPTSENQIKAAAIVRSLCEERGLKIICLQPFMHYEGLRDRAAHARRIDEMKLWIQIAHTLGTDLLAIPSTFLGEAHVTDDMDLIVKDLQEVADLGAASGIRYAYEALAWGTRVDTWEACWEVVQKVNRPNFGICIDTFNLAARAWADPASASGKTANADAELEKSLRRMVKAIDVDKIAFVQVVDAERLDAPLDEAHELFDACQPARMSWSRNCRLFYGEHDRGAYLPIHTILHTLIVEMGYTGYLSAEMFNRSLAVAQADVPQTHAERAAESWSKLVSDFGLNAPIHAAVPAAEPPRAQL